jgi:hypothetical protein
MVILDEDGEWKASVRMDGIIVGLFLAVVLPFGSAN